MLFRTSANVSTSPFVRSIARLLSKYAVQVGVCVSALVVSSSSTWAITATRSLTTRVCSIKRSIIEYASRACCKSRSSAIPTATNKWQLGYSRLDVVIDEHGTSRLDKYVANITETDVAG